MENGAETTVNSARAYNAACNGAKKFDRDIMVTMYAGEAFYDFFLYEDQAEQFAREILDKVKNNRKA